ncbi:Gmad2 immunoglobulin-like domain-containing protein [Haloechinothrix sp. LS1_15]|uniref:Gmad2 immunoglobulin-like domain-containing protein n=1 Tax=Haloechinothrix sp. LS1_15 TaxID=2652248 RepID=UPI00294745F6|nr:Gmad2 immunoglobulin-like domain-containing protein [Haloechinothrix sp. LS1_15]MDV6011405.1 LysM peptidoglycan-binding domain-containing protein [Haloechinothrix sp. LS1_15]
MALALDPSFRVDQPRPNDLVGDPLLIAGMGGGFEGTITIVLLDGNGHVLKETFTTNTNLSSQWQATIDLPDPPTTHGVLQVGPATGADEHPGLVSVPVQFGTAIVAGYRSHFHYTVQQGDTLSSIAAEQAPLYIGTGFQPIVEANRHIISDPDVIHPGMVLRLPSDF